MNPEIWVQALVFGILIGALYGVAALGFSLVYGVMKVLNIAHGSLIMLGAYGSFWLFALWGIDPYASLPLVALALFLIGLAIYGAILSRVARLSENLKINTSLLVTFGLILILDTLAVVFFTGDERSITPPYSGLTLRVQGIALPVTRLASLVVCILVVFALHLFLRRTYFGKSIRAVTQNWRAASMVGIDISRTYLISFGLSAALAGIAGTLVGVGAVIFPAMGMDWTLKALIIVALGGMGNTAGSLAAGFLLGIVESISALFIGPYMSAVGLAMFLLVISLRPQGLFGFRVAAI